MMEFLITIEELACIGSSDGGISTSKGMRKICLAVKPSRSDVKLPFITTLSYSAGKPSLILAMTSSAATNDGDSPRAALGATKNKTSPKRIRAKDVFTGHLLSDYSFEFKHIL